ncbi:uncharacterized protein A4U43_C08F35130 [Asparagus officinalis]|nr:uncharacterized protein A4U43_C08F35130 [Asparagus officinalis]
MGATYGAAPAADGHVSAAASHRSPWTGLGHSFCYSPTSQRRRRLLDLRRLRQLPTPPPPSPASSYSPKPRPPAAAAAAFESSARFLSPSPQPILASPRALSRPAIRPRPSVFSPRPIRARVPVLASIDPRAGPLSRPLRFPSPACRRSASSAFRGLSKAIRRTVGRHEHKPSKELNSVENSSGFISVDEIIDKDGSFQWAQGKAGEDRVHVVISEEHGWVFVGIYDGFNGPDATDYLLTNLYPEVQKELERLDLGGGNHGEVLKALSRALMRTEGTFLDCADMMVTENPELSLMGSCVLVMVMKGQDVYLMNVGDSRAILGTKGRRDLRSINEEMDGLLDLVALQLTLDHSTCVKEEVVRIRSEHPDDSSAIVNDRVKGSLKVTRAFGAGFLKQPKWNNALLEMFRIDYIGNSPYITCNPSLHHRKLDTGDRFLILSSDGLYQYFTNEEAVAEVELFISTTPEGDPAQHLIEELLFRAAKKAGMDFHDLLEIPQGDRRRYHDDVSVIVISLEGRIWRSCV